jgi:hypothetical protein
VRADLERVAPTEDFVYIERRDDDEWRRVAFAGEAPDLPERMDLRTRGADLMWKRAAIDILLNTGVLRRCMQQRVARALQWGAAQLDPPRAITVNFTTTLAVDDEVLGQYVSAGIRSSLRNGRL